MNPKQPLISRKSHQRSPSDADGCSSSSSSPVHDDEDDEDVRSLDADEASRSITKDRNLLLMNDDDDLVIPGITDPDDSTPKMQLKELSPSPSHAASALKQQNNKITKALTTTAQEAQEAPGYANFFLKLNPFAAASPAEQEALVIAPAPSKQ